LSIERRSGGFRRRVGFHGGAARQIVRLPDRTRWLPKSQFEIQN
jgi:hypothetical protein